MSLQRRTSPPRKSRIIGFTFPELLVVIAIGGVLGVTLLPSLNTAKETANAAVCLSNMHQWSLAISMYCEEYNDYTPQEGQGTPVSISPSAWYNVIPQYVNTPSLTTLYAQGKPPTPATKSIYSCPSTTNYPANPTDAIPFYMYGMNNRMDPNGPGTFKRAQSVKPSETMMFCENEGSFSSTNGKYCPARHSGGSNFSFVDGHADWVKHDDFCREGTLASPCAVSPGVEPNSTATGDWKPGNKYHWFPYKNAPA
jgi:prepilin-type processing-associated H-X9-DG protein/prepilin-type N-terminal cleavage/methylation domain-containing protein